MVSRGGVAPFDGDLDDYQRYLLDEAKRQREAIKEASSAAAKAQAKALKASSTAAAKPKSVKRDLELVEARMATLNTEGAALEVRLSGNPLPSEIAEIGKRITAVNDELKTLEDQWLELSAQMESV